MIYTTHFPWAILQIPPGFTHPNHSFTTYTTHSPRAILPIPKIDFQIYTILNQSYMYPIQLNPLGLFLLPQTLLPIPPGLSLYTNHYPRDITSQLSPYNALPASIVIALTRDGLLVKCLLVASNSIVYSVYGVKLVNT